MLKYHWPITQEDNVKWENKILEASELCGSRISKQTFTSCSCIKIRNAKQESLSKSKADVDEVIPEGLQ